MNSILHSIYPYRPKITGNIEKPKPVRLSHPPEGWNYPTKRKIEYVSDISQSGRKKKHNGAAKEKHTQTKIIRNITYTAVCKCRASVTMAKKQPIGVLFCALSTGDPGPPQVPKQPQKPLEKRGPGWL